MKPFSMLLLIGIIPAAAVADDGHPPTALYQGVNKLSSIGLQAAVKGRTNTSTTNTSGMSHIEYKVAKSTDELCKILDISSSASVGWLTGSVSVKSKLMEEMNCSSTDTFMIVRAVHAKNIENAVDVKLKEGITFPTNDQKLGDFVNLYGDSYVSSITTGAEFFAVYKFHANTLDEKKSLELNISANNDGAVSTKAEFNMKLNTARKMNNVTYSVHYNCAGLETTLPKPEELIDFAEKFLTIPVEKGAVISYGLSDYDSLMTRDEKKIFQPVIKNKGRLFGSLAKREGLVQKMAKINELKNQIKELISIYEYYGPFKDAALEEELKMAKKDASKLGDVFDSYLSDPSADLPEIDTPSLAKGLPVLNYTLSTSPLFGGDGDANYRGGQPFADLDASNANVFLHGHFHLASLQFSSGRYIDKISSVYTSSITSNIWQPQIHQGTDAGGSGGTLSTKLAFQDGEFIQSADGRSGAYVDRIHIKTNKGHDCLGGGNGGDHAFSWTVPSGMVVLGFGGRAGRYCDQLYLITAAFQPANWKRY